MKGERDEREQAGAARRKKPRGRGGGRIIRDWGMNVRFYRMKTRKVVSDR